MAPGAECVPQCEHGSAAWSGQLVRDGIGVDDGSPELAEDLCGRGLAAADAAGKADDKGHDEILRRHCQREMRQGKAPAR